MSEMNDKNKGHLLDLKLPIGWLFSAYGVILTVYGLVSKKEIYSRSLGLNINLVWGVVLFVFGVSFLLFTFLKKNKTKG